jgi:predicted nuclease with TOPRIM domain
LARSQLASESHLPEIKLSLQRTLTLCDKVLENQNENHKLQANLELKRAERKTIWKHFVDDMSHKCSRVDNTFEEKEEELREFYSDLERKLHIHK